VKSLLKISDREDVAKSIAAGLMLLSVFGLAVYYAFMVPQPSEGAVRLVIRRPSQLQTGVEGDLTILAVNKEGEIDQSRNDVVRISLNTGSCAQLGFADLSGTIWSNSLVLKLQSGRGEVKIIDRKTERVQISVEWLEGKSHLETFVTEMIEWRVA
jgi:hypothetical protein